MSTRRRLPVSALAVALSAWLACLAPPVEAASEATCQRYARRAVDQHQLMGRRARCVVRDDARWHPNYRSHREWCLQAPVTWVRSEEKARDDHLYRCGGQIRFD